MVAVCSKPVDNKAAERPSDFTTLKTTFMRHVTRALKTKGCPGYARTARRIFGRMVGYLADYPQESQAVMAAIDYLPHGWTPNRYVQAAAGVISEWRHRHLSAFLAEPFAGDPRTSGPVSIGEAMAGVMSRMGAG